MQAMKEKVPWTKRSACPEQLLRATALMPRSASSRPPAVVASRPTRRDPSQHLATPSRFVGTINGVQVRGPTAGTRKRGLSNCQTARSSRCSKRAGPPFCCERRTSGGRSRRRSGPGPRRSSLAVMGSRILTLSFTPAGPDLSLFPQGIHAEDLLGCHQHSGPGFPTGTQFPKLRCLYSLKYRNRTW